MSAVGALPEHEHSTLDIIGPGAIGLHMALALPETLHVRLRHPDFRPGRGTAVTDEDTGRQRPVALLGLTDPSPITLAIITTKSYQVEPVLRAVRSHWSAGAEVLLLHNGLGPQCAARALLPASTALWVGVTTEAALRTGPLRRRPTGAGETVAGPWAGQSRPGRIAHWLEATSLHTTWLSDSRQVRDRVWRKLIINCAVNPLTAEYRIPNGALSQPDLQRQWRPLVDEALQVAAAEGIVFDAQELQAQVAGVIAATAGNYSSMHQDVLHRRPTEATAILGVLARKGARHGLHVPHIDRLWHRFKSGAG